MQLTVHEAQDLRELIMGCANTITNMACFLSQVQDQQLQQILSSHFPVHVKNYNMKVELFSQATGMNMSSSVPNIQKFMQPSMPQQMLGSMPSTSPRTHVNQLDDREIATTYLLNMKRSGREYAWAAMEMSNPQVRIMLEDSFRTCSHHAYDVWQWMVAKGYYPVEMAPSTSISAVAQMFNTVPMGMMPQPSMGQMRQ